MRNNSVLRITDLFFSLRPILLVPVWGFCAFGYYRAKFSGMVSIKEIWKTTSLEVYLTFIIFSLSVGVVYLLNQIADVEVDKKNGGLPLIASEIVSLRDAWIFVILLSIISVVFPLLMSKPLLSLFSVITIGIGILYSFRPIFFSGKIFLDFLSNALGYGCIAFGVGWWIGGNDIFTYKFAVSSLPYFLLMCSGSISSTLPDIPGDKTEGKFTTAVVLGNKRAHLLSLCTLISATIISIILKDYIALVCSIISLPFYIGYLLKPNRFMMEATYKIGGGACMVIACIICPYILLISCSIFMVTKIYFKKRHDVNYPSMVSNEK